MKNYKKLGIISLIFLAVNIVLSLISISYISMILVPIVSLLFLASLILSIISIVGMKKHHEKGIWIPIIASVLSFIGFAVSGYFAIFMIRLFFAFRPDTIYTYEVPMTVTINTYNVDYSTLSTADRADLYVFEHPKGDKPNEECIPEFFQLRGLRSPNLIYFEKDALYSNKAPEGYRETYRGSYKSFPLDLVKDEPSGE